ncbi:hypothetical protein RHMOL_Rhmol05G0163000 [Rhododendron molle]|uniref:Uncharacterized protein n=1 Tax=Rhododendron molle TaxID=49168 RepID=A0ACC0NPI1_RHOML|nr:hypothetical protein RHMOL_Rhmol05G0163000 [Rhododendron molle]
MATLNAVIGDLSSISIPSRQLNPISTICNPIFAMADQNSSKSFGKWFRAMMLAFPEPEPEIDMQAMLDPLDGIFLYMLFQQPEPLVPEEEYYWDLEPAWPGVLNLDPNPLQGYAIPDHLSHFVEGDLVPKEPRVLGECFFPSTISRLVDSVTDSEYDPTLNTIDEGLPRPVVPCFEIEDCSIMVTDLVLPANL